MRLTLLVTLVLLSPFAPAEDRSITILAEGYVEAEPDTLTFTVTIKNTQSKLGEAKAAADREVTALLQAAHERGVDPEDIDSSSMQAFPEYEWRAQQRHYLGETVVRTVTFTLHDLELYPPLVEILGKLEPEMMGNPTLSHSRLSELKLDALRAALGQGKRKAAAIAAEIDARLGEVVSVNEISAGRPQPLMLMAEAASNDGGGNAGFTYARQRISASVEMRFALQ